MTLGLVVTAWGQTIEEVALDVATTRWSSAIALAILCYDTVLTLGDEIRLIWPKRWSVTKVFLYLNRAVTFFFVFTHAIAICGAITPFSHDFCQTLFMSTGYGAFVSFAMSNWIMLSRTIALFGDSRIFKYFMTIFYLVAYSITAVLVTTSTVPFHQSGAVFYTPPMRACGIAIRPSTLGYVWIAPMTFETVIFVLTILKLYQRAFETYKLGSKLLMVLYRDGVCYYLVIIALRIFNLFWWLTQPPSRLFVGFLLLWVAMCIAVTRLQLNLLRVIEPLTKTTVIEASQEGAEKWKLDRLDGRPRRIGCKNDTAIMFSRSAILAPSADEIEWSEDILTPTLIAQKKEEEDEEEEAEHADLGIV